MRSCDHPTKGLLGRAIDDELSGSDIAFVESHLSTCESCKQEYHELRSVSSRLESALAEFVPAHSPGSRETLLEQLELRERPRKPTLRLKSASRLGWGVALAAGLVIGLFFGPQWKRDRSIAPAILNEEARAANGAIEVDGETFQALPYSNPDLPINTRRIVQMQVPVSSLADAGIVFEPISSEVSAPDRSVLADVLLGLDGQPLGVHVLAAE